ncbi:MAG: protein-disulfide reductase DsbD domain-containing protein [Tepidisphaeraceae bacterium]|jgi:DsbC/DsbD-like thiol-disulfide interchange protein
MFTRACYFCVAALVSCLGVAEASAAHVQAELLANASAVQPGKPFWLGVRLSIDPGWHVYWKNPGDAGLPTRVNFSLPDGFTAGPLEFPTPRRFVQPGNIVAFGYEDSVMLLTKITPPPNLPADFQGRFQAAVSWLVCSDVCILGKATPSLALASSPSPVSANRELFDDWISQLPVNWADNREVAAVHSRTTPGNANPSARSCVLEIAWTHPAPKFVDFLPEALNDYNLLQTAVKSSQNTTVIGFTLETLAGKTPGPQTLQAVVGYLDKDGKRRGINISVALPAQDANNH